LIAEFALRFQTFRRSSRRSIAAPRQYFQLIFEQPCDGDIRTTH
jgi:hypothetical protein